MRRVWKVVLMAGALGAAFLAGQSPSHFDQWWTADNDALAAAPQHHKLLFENEEVKVLEVTASGNRCMPTGIRVSCITSRLPI